MHLIRYLTNIWGKKAGPTSLGSITIPANIYHFQKFTKSHNFGMQTQKHNLDQESADFFYIMDWILNILEFPSQLFHSTIVVQSSHRQYLNEWHDCVLITLYLCTLNFEFLVSSFDFFPTTQKCKIHS